MGSFVGIDLGTTFSVVAYINSDGKPEAIPNEQNNFLTPSVVDLRSNPIIIGEEAKEKQSFGDEGVYAFFKRDMGNVNALYIENEIQYTPIDLSSFVLSYLKGCAEEFLKRPVTDAVITVPAYFNNMQRQATIEAGKKAGLNVLRIINEPTAAAYAYGVRPSNAQSKVLVYDLGGGTFDISLVEITSSELRVIATAGDHMLGGKDWDDRILQYLATEFEHEFGTELIGEEFNELLTLAEITKIILSTKQSVKVSVQGNGHSGAYEITRSQFEDLTRDLMERTKMLVNQVLEDAKFTWKNIDGVVLVGGSTRMPMVREYVEQMSGKPVLTGVNPDEAVALGAAIQAAIDIEIQAQTQEPIFQLAGRKKSTDVMSHSLGMIAVNEDNTKYINSIIIQKNLAIPCQQTRPYQLRVRRSGENKLEVFMTQGETTDPMSCAYLGKYVFTEIPLISAKTAVIDITYAYDLNGVVNVTAVERSTQAPLKLNIEPLPDDVPDRFCLPPVVETIREHLNLYMAFDLSGSMSDEPLQEAKKAAWGFVRECDITNTSIGIIEFSDKTMTMTKASQNVKKITHGVDNLQIGRTGYGNETHPFDEIFQHLNKAKGLRYALVLTDGVWSNQDKAIRAAKRCHESGIEIIAVGFGDADRRFLKQISSSEDLSFFTNLADLSETFSSIAQELTEGGGQINNQNMQQRRKGLRLWG
jgi:molecular chaperone DnaK